MLKIYIYLIFPVLKFCFWIGTFFSSKLKEGWQQRKTAAWFDVPREQRPIIIHASSGEFEYAKPVIRELKKAHPEIKIFVSYFSPTYRKAIEATPGVDLSFPMIWEQPSLMKYFIEYHRPRALLIARTDIWPGLIAAYKEAHIPTAVFSTTLSSTSSRLKNPLIRWFTTWSYTFIDYVFCVSEDDLKNFQLLGSNKKVMALGDTRFDQVEFRLQNPKPLKEELRPQARNNTLICGSTWPEDEAVIIPALSQIKNDLSNGKSNSNTNLNSVSQNSALPTFQTLLAPHEPTMEHLEHLENMLQGASLTFARYSTSSRNDVDVLLIDKVGILAELYQWGTFAFVGGSFKKTVHSVMEPLASGCVTFFGPLHTNNREALIFKSLRSRNGLPLASEIKSAQDLVRQIRNFHSADLDLHSYEIKTTLHSYTGATHALLKALDIV